MRKAALVAFLMLGGCIFNEHPAVRPLRPLEIPTAPYWPIATDTATGSMMYEGGCLLFRNEQTQEILMPVWPQGSSFNGTALLYHLPGKADQWLAISQEVLIYGQPLPWDSLARTTYEPFQHQCGAYAPFFVSNVRPAD
jgi:hypothetical protein